MSVNILKNIRNKKPLIHCIINNVAVSDTAQLLKNIGASPVMAYSFAECAEVTKQADALLINTGTLTHQKRKAIFKSLNAANKKKIPVILDIVGYGLSGFRTKTINKIIKKYKIDIIKGNKSEISILTCKTGVLKGIESGSFDKKIFEESILFAEKNRTTIVITGKKDFITNKIKSAFVENGVSLMSEVIGSGCMLGSVIASFASVYDDFFNASLEAVCFYGIIAEVTLNADKKISPYKFKINFIDNFFKSVKLDSINKKRKIKFIKK